MDHSNLVNEKFCERLKKHSALRERFESISIADVNGDCVKTNDAEEHVIEEAV